MPRTTLPPTPASSTDMKSQDGSKQLAALQMAFELPPPAIIPSAENAAGMSPTETSKTPYLQASETVKSRRRSSAAQVQGSAKDQFALPPPPTRSRKIIQMKPREDPIPETSCATAASSSKTATPKNASGASSAAASTVSTATATGTKRKQPSATSAAGRKIARKTAHSQIERRRRSKMNEEFAVLKGMIPACTDEMHKLAILQASIEYIRYLEDCVGQLKEQQSSDSNPRPFEPTLPTPTGHDHNPDQGYFNDDRSTDVEMAVSEAPSPSSTAYPSRSAQPSISPSPAMLAQDLRHRHDSYSSVSTDHRHYSYSALATTSPAFGPQVYGYAHSTHSASGSTLTSPALLPERDLDQEATAALLMLNQTDRRGNGGSTSGRGMSVRDLLTT